MSVPVLVDILTIEQADVGVTVVFVDEQVELLAACMYRAGERCQSKHGVILVVDDVELRVGGASDHVCGDVIAVLAAKVLALAVDVLSEQRVHVLNAACGRLGEVELQHLEVASKLCGILVDGELAEQVPLVGCRGFVVVAH